MDGAAQLAGAAPGDDAATSPDDVEEASFEEFSVVQVPLTVAAVAARLGVAASTLRTWDRRYGLGPSGRSAGSHRRYTADDVARLETMRRLTLAGAAPSDAARLAARNVPGGPGVNVLSTLPGLPPKVDGLTLAAAAIDGEEHRVRRLLAVAVRSWGIVGAWTEVVQAAFGFLDEREAGDRPGRDPEHILAGAVLATVRAASEGVAAARPQVVICADPALVIGRLGADVLASALAERGVAAVVVRGPADPDRIRRVLDGANGVLAVIGSSPAGEALARAVSEPGGLSVIGVGVEAPAVWLPGVQRVRTFAGAVHEIAGALEAQSRPDPSDRGPDGEP